MADRRGESGRSGQVALLLQAGGLGRIPVVVITGRSMDRKNVEMVRLESNVKEFMDVLDAALEHAEKITVRTE